MERIVFALILLFVASCTDKWTECRKTTIKMMEIHLASHRIAREDALLMKSLTDLPNMDDDSRYVEMVEFLKKEFLHFTLRSMEYLIKARENEKRCDKLLR